MIASLALRTDNVPTGFPMWELQTFAAMGVRVLEIQIQQSTAASQALGLGRGNPPGEGLNGVLFQNDDPEDSPSLTVAATEWTVSEPVVPVIFLRRWGSMSAVPNVGTIWTFPRGLLVRPDSSLLIWNIGNSGLAGTGACDITCIIDE